MKTKIFTLFVALLTSSALWAYDFQSGDLYYNITSSSEPYTVEVTFQERGSDSNYSGLTTATIPETVTNNGTTYSVTRIGESAFSGCNALTSITIPNSVTSIGSSAFSGCYALTSINIPNSVMSIGSNAFWCCASLTSITIPNSVTSIGSNAFWSCSSLTSITIPNSVTSIGEDAFFFCISLTSVTLTGSTIESFCQSITNKLLIDAGAGWSRKIEVNDQEITDLIIPNSVTSIGDYAFSGCTSFTSVTIGNGVTSIGDYAFCDAALTSIVVPDNVTFIGKGAFCDMEETLKSAVIGSGVKELNATFVECMSLESVILSEGLETIGDQVFNGCNSLNRVNIPHSVTSIGKWAFTGCLPLESIVIPSGVTTIGDRAFGYCKSLTTVICKAIEVPELGADVFEDMPLSEATLYVPAQSLENYKAAEQWKDFGTILPLDKAPSAVENTRLPITNSTKLLRNGQVYILQDGKTYTVMGQKL